MENTINAVASSPVAGSAAKQVISVVGNTLRRLAEVAATVSEPDDIDYEWSTDPREADEDDPLVADARTALLQLYMSCNISLATHVSAQRPGIGVTVTFNQARLPLAARVDPQGWLTSFAGSFWTKVGEKSVNALLVNPARQTNEDLTVPKFVEYVESTCLLPLYEAGFSQLFDPDSARAISETLRSISEADVVAAREPFDSALGPFDMAARMANEPPQGPMLARASLPSETPLLKGVLFCSQVESGGELVEALFRQGTLGPRRYDADSATARLSAVIGPLSDEQVEDFDFMDLMLAYATDENDGTSFVDSQGETHPLVDPARVTFIIRSGDRDDLTVQGDTRIPAAFMGMLNQAMASTA